MTRNGRVHGVLKARRNEISNHYRKGSDDNLVVNENGEKGNALEELYINKDNQVASKVITNSSSIPATWQSQHLWNHLSQLNVNKFVYDAENEVYSYEYDATNVDELYFLTYLSYSLTPVLTETLYKVYLKIENGAITQLIAQTEPVLYPEGAEEPDATSYSVIELTFSDIGTTEIEQPATYEAGENSDVLQNALDAMKASKELHVPCSRHTAKRSCNGSRRLRNIRIFVKRHRKSCAGRQDGCNRFRRSARLGDGRRNSVVRNYKVRSRNG